jgi:hypothetical protein
MKADILPDKAKVTDGNMICQDSEKVGKTDSYRFSSPHLQITPTVVHGTNSAQ